MSGTRTTGYRGPRSPRPPADPLVDRRHGEYAGLCAAVEGVFFVGEMQPLEKAAAMDRLEREARALGLLAGERTGRWR